MLKSLRKLIKTPEKVENDNELELKLAAATLMFEVVRSDGQIDDVELAHMSQLLKREFKLDDEELELLLKDARDSAHNAISLHGFTREICDNWDNAKRMKLLEYLWILALADKEIDPHERHLVRKVAGLLYINQAQIIESRELAKRQLGLD